MSAPPPPSDPPDEGMQTSEDVDAFDASVEDTKANEDDMGQEIIDLTTESDFDQIAVAAVRSRPVTPKQEPQEPSQALSAQPEAENSGEILSRFDPEVTGMEGTGNIDAAAMEIDPTVGQSAMAMDVQLPNLHESIEAPGDFLKAHSDEQLQEMFERNQLNFPALPPEESAPNADKQHTLQQTPASIDEESENKAAAAEFQRLKKRYERRKDRDETTFSEDISYKRAYDAEQCRIRLQKRKLDHADDERRAAAQNEDERMFISEDEDAHDAMPMDSLFTGLDTVANETTLPKRPTQGRRNKMPVSALEESMRVGREAAEARDKKGAKKERKRKDPATKKVPSGRITKPKVKKATEKVAAPKKRGRPRRGPAISNLTSLFTSDPITDAQANEGLPDQPGFKSKVRKDALKELIASIPDDQRNLYGADRAALHRACQSFSKAMKADGADGWRLTGMRSSLRHYQLLGAAFMRDRENSNTRPFGGIQSDEMGLGKTVMTIANILDGMAPARSANRTTLIVCPSALISQWFSEISKHTMPGAFGEVLVYRSGSRPLTNDPVRTLSAMDIIVTSYQEVLKSFPVYDPPPHIVSDAGKDQWWREHYEKKKGLLHRIVFHRIVIDESQIIKNHLSKTSTAVCALTGKLRWAISATPIQNSLKEFYPFFKFLKVDNTGCFELFKRNFCRRGVARERLSALLLQIMVRRTHLDRLFGIKPSTPAVRRHTDKDGLGAPILKLPNINRETIPIVFSETERAIYRIVKTRFLSKIRAYAKADEIEKKYQQVFVLLLRLRQLTGHILLIQKTLTELLEAEDIERLWRLTEENPKSPDEENLCRLLQQGIESARNEQRAGQENPGLAQGTHSLKDGLNVPTGNPGVAKQFRGYLKSLREDGRWEKVNEKCLCHACGGVPSNPYITSCMHIYCYDCLQAMAFSAAHNGQEKTRCLACGSEYENVEPLQGFDEAGKEDGSPCSVRSGFRKGKKSAGDDEEGVDWFTVGGPILRSAKTRATESQIRDWLKEDKDAKVIVFTQFIGMLKVMSRICQENGWGSVMFHGGMSFDTRDKAIRDFSEEPETNILLASLKCGGTGLNLCAANRVIVIDRGSSPLCPLCQS